MDCRTAEVRNCGIAQRTRVLAFVCSLVSVLTAFAAFAQEPSPSPNLLPGANSPAESAALAYMHTAMRSEFLYKQKHHEYARTLASLVGSGSFTRRMSRPDRGDYTVRYSSNGERYEMTLVPRTFDEQHRSFFVNEEGKIHVEDRRAATAQSAVLDTKKH